MQVPATSTIDSLCSADTPANIVLNIVNYSSGTGQTYQWQSSPNGTNYSDISGTTPTATAVVSQSTWYQCLVTCSGNTQASEPVFVNVKPTPQGDLPNNPFIIGSTPYTNDNNNLSSNCYTSDYVGNLEQASPDVFYKITISDSIGKLYISTCNTTDLNTYLHLLDNNGVDLDHNDGNGELCSTSNKASLIYEVASVPSTFYIVCGRT
jgi:hypothetical protein